MLTDPAVSDDPTTTMLCQLRRWWAICGLVLFTATWRLWVPQSVFPQVPLFRWASALPSGIDWLCFGSMIVALIAAAIGSRRRRPAGEIVQASGAASAPRFCDEHIGELTPPHKHDTQASDPVRFCDERTGRLTPPRSPMHVILLVNLSQIAWPVFAVACAGSIVIDQHRLQPWAWLLLLMSVLFHGEDHGNSPSIKTLLRWLTISVYIWSAVSKIDRSFFTTHGPTLVDALFQTLGMVGLSGVVKWWLAVALPIGELLVAVGLSWPRCRRIALWGAIGLHVALILALGPFGLGHRPGVLLWNVAFIGHVWLLFRRHVSSNPMRQRVRTLQDAPKSQSCEATALANASGYDVKAQRASAARAAIILFAVLWPITESFGLCDHWLAWSVYSTRTERVSVMLTAEGIQQLPKPIQRLVAGGELPLDRWSIDSLYVPIYPQLRFQLGVVEWLRLRCGDANVLEVIVVLPGSRLKADVATEFLPGDQMPHRLQEFWLNALPTINQRGEAAGT